MRGCKRLRKLVEGENDESLFTVKDIRRSATEIVMDTIKSLLVRKKIKAGDKLPSETELAEKLNISRGSVREAMKILNAYGIVTIKRGDGTYISDSTSSKLDPLLFKLITNQDSFKELRELREMLEIGIIKLAIKNATENDIESLEATYELTEKMIKANKYEDEIIIDAEHQFHTCLGNATHNKLIMTIYNYVMELYIPNLYKEKDDERFGPEALMSHRPIIDAIINKDSLAGERAIKYSIEVWRDQAERIQKKME